MYNIAQNHILLNLSTYAHTHICTSTHTYIYAYSYVNIHNLALVNQIGSSSRGNAISTILSVNCLAIVLCLGWDPIKFLPFTLAYLLMVYFSGLV